MDKKRQVKKAAARPPRVKPEAFPTQEEAPGVFEDVSRAFAREGPGPESGERQELQSQELREGVEPAGELDFSRPRRLR